MAELEAKISADASDLIRETKKASNAWGSFTKALARDGANVSRAVGDVSSSAGDLTTSLKKTAKAASQLNFKKTKEGFKDIAKNSARAARGLFLLGKSLSKIGFNVLAAGARVALTAVKSLAVGVGALSVVLAGIGTKAVVEFGKFQSSFAQVRTLVDESQVDIANLETGVRDLAVSFGVNLKESTVAAYQAISAGVNPAKVVGFLKTAFEGAAAGAATVTETVNLVTSALNAFNKPVEEAGRVSDIFFATIAAGKTTASELAASIGQIAPIASVTGVSLEEVGASLATLTASGLSTAEAATGLKAIIAGIIQPSGKAAVALEKIGVSADTLRSAGLTGVLSEIKEEIDSGRARINDFLPNLRALGPGAVLAGEGFTKLQANLKKTTNSLGETSKAASKVLGGIGKSFGSFRTAVNNAFVSLGKVIAPAVQGALTEVTTFLVGVQKETELLAVAFESRFGPAIAGFFSKVGTDAKASGGLASSALKQLSNGLQFLAKQSVSAAKEFGALVGAFRLVFNAGQIVFRLFKSGLIVSLNFLAKAVRVNLQGLQALAAIFSDDMAKSIGEGVDSINEFTATLDGELASTAEDISGDLDDIFNGVPATAHAAEGAARRFARGLAVASDGAAALGDDLDVLREKQKKEAEEAKAAAEATEEHGDSQKKLATAVEQVSPRLEELAARTEKLRAGNIAAADSVGGLSKEMATLARSSAFDPFAVLAASAGVSIGSVRGLRGEITAAIRSVGNMDEALRTTGQNLLREFGGGLDGARINSVKFKAEIDKLNAIELQFLDPGVFEQFIAAAGSAGLDITNFSKKAVSDFAVLSNVLKGDFRKAGDLLVEVFAKGKISSREFGTELRRLAGVQLGFDDLFRSVDQLAEGFKSVSEAAKEARGVLGTELRDGVQKAREEFDAGTITFDQYTAKIREAGNAAREFAALSEGQLVVFQELREENKALADQVLGLAGTLDEKLKPAFDDFLEAFRQGGLSAEELGKKINGLVKENQDLAKETKKASGAIADQGKVANTTARANDKLAASNDRVAASAKRSRVAAVEGNRAFFDYSRAAESLGASVDATSAQLQLQFDLLSEGKTNFFDATTGVELLASGQGKLINQVNTLGAALDDVGQRKLARLTDAFGEGILSVDEFKAQVKSLAEEFGKLGDAATSASGKVKFQQGKGNSGQAGGGPGGSGFNSFGNADAGASAFGTSTVTGSSNFLSDLEERIGAALGLKPKALRSAAQRAGGLKSLVRNRGLDPDDFGLVNGGAIQSSGPASVEAGEFMLSQRGVADLGAVFAEMLNKGQASGGGGAQTINNTFNTGRGGDGGNEDIQELAFRLGPAILESGKLAASRSPIN